jgi:hypothetical protein
MPAHITIAHGDAIFAGSLAKALRSEGHEVLTVTDTANTVPPPQSTGTLELTITQAAGRHRGARIRVPGLPRDKPYAGVLGLFLADPIEVSDVMRAMQQIIG